VKAIQADFPVRTACRVLRVSPSGYYDWLDRKPCRRAQANAELMQRIDEVHRASDATYGMPRVHAELAARGIVAGRNRIARLMRAHGLRGVSRRRGWCVTTRRSANGRPAADLVQRHFTAVAPNELWVADTTYIPTWAGFGYLAVVLDVFSRKVVGWAFGQRQTANLVLAALNMALQTRRPEGGVIHHSDQGSTYTSLEFGKRCSAMGVRPSMGSVGDAYDNAMAESFFASLECELIDRRVWKTFVDARLEIFTWIEGWYNPRRRHSALQYLSPIDFEARHRALGNDPTDGPNHEHMARPGASGGLAGASKDEESKHQDGGACGVAHRTTRPRPSAKA
jgi:putative transposase